MSTSSISFFQADRNWYIQQRIWTLSASRSTDSAAPAGPTTPAAPGRASHQVPAVASIADQQALRVTDDLKSAQINALELSSSSRTGYTSSIATSAGLLKLYV